MGRARVRNRGVDVRSPRRQAALGASMAGTFAIVLCSFCAVLYATGETSSQLAKSYAIWIGVGFGISSLLDLQTGVRNLIRADFLCLACLYFLVLTEFLFPQEDFDKFIEVEATVPALELFALAFSCFAISRHWVKKGVLQDAAFRFSEVNVNILVGLYLGCAFLAYLHMLLAVNFNVFTMLESMIGPRFAVPWQRGKFGGWKELLNELGLLFTVIPALAGVLWHLRKRMEVWQKLVVLLLFSLTLFHGFCSGTRNVFAGYLAGFLGAYMLTHPRLTVLRVFGPGLVVAVLFFWGSYHMLEFRQIGLKNYLEGEIYASEETRDTLFVDYNLLAIAKMMETFPERADYLGWEIPMWCVIKPIPRAIWSGKPEGLTTSIEEAMGVEGVTISTTYIGEAYMSFGVVGVVVFSCIFGVGTAWWNRLGSDTRSTYSVLIFASGLAAFALCMRSMMWFSTAILPTVALVVAHRLWMTKEDPRRRRNRHSSPKIAVQPEGEAKISQK
ncbi:MAG: hypothetical protein ACQKBU_10100 [Verrucomicrobiales bacterium]